MKSVTGISNSLRSKFSCIDGHTQEVLLKSISSTFVKAGGMAIALGISIYLGRTLGAEGLGIINLSNRIVTIALLFCLFGVRTALIKNIAINHRRKNWQQIANFMHSAYIFNGVLSILVVCGLIMLVPWLSETVFEEPELKTPLIIMLIAMIPQTFSRIFGAGINGYQKIWQSNLFDQTLSVLILGLSLMVFYVLGYAINVIFVALAYGGSRLVVGLVTGIYWNKIFKIKVKPRTELRRLIKPAIPLFWISISSVLAANVDAVMLGWLGNTREVGLYTVAANIALLTSFFLQITNSVIAPKLAGLYAEEKKKEMQKMVQQITMGLIVIGGLASLIFILFGKDILGIWGAEFKLAYSILVIISIGQFFNIASGCSGLLLVMCGHEKLYMYISSSFLILNLTMNFFLISLYGAIGAAISTALTVTLENIFKIIVGKWKLGISTLPFLYEK